MKMAIQNFARVGIQVALIYADTTRVGKNLILQIQELYFRFPEAY